jgi:hypothetical protein
MPLTMRSSAAFSRLIGSFSIIGHRLDRCPQLARTGVFAKSAMMMAEAATRYWRVRLDFEWAVSCAQRMETPEGRFHPLSIQTTACRWSKSTAKHCKAASHTRVGCCVGRMETNGVSQGPTSLHRREIRADRTPNRRRFGLSPTLLSISPMVGRTQHDCQRSPAHLPRPAAHPSGSCRPCQAWLRLLAEQLQLRRLERVPCG